MIVHVIPLTCTRLNATVLSAVLSSSCEFRNSAGIRLLQPFKVASSAEPDDCSFAASCESHLPIRAKDVQLSCVYLSNMQRLQWLLTLLAVSCTLFGVAQSANTQQLTLAASGCTALEFQDLSQKFHYDAQVVVTGNASCLSISRLYVQDACINERNNELGLNTVKQISCDQASDSSTKTCSTVFSSAPSGTIVNGTIANSGSAYDSGDVCAAQDNAYIFAQNLCTDTLNIQVTVTTSDYKGHICLDIAGRHINGVGIALIIAAILIVVVLLALVCYCCCCRW